MAYQPVRTRPELQMLPNMENYHFIFAFAPLLAFWGDEAYNLYHPGYGSEDFIYKDWHLRYFLYIWQAGGIESI